MSSGQLYDTIGATYTVTRRTEPRIAARIWAAPSAGWVQVAGTLRSTGPLAGLVRRVRPDVLFQPLVQRRRAAQDSRHLFLSLRGVQPRRNRPVPPANQALVTQQLDPGMSSGVPAGSRLERLAATHLKPRCPQARHELGQLDTFGIPVGRPAVPIQLGGGHHEVARCGRQPIRAEPDIPTPLKGCVDLGLVRRLVGPEPHVPVRPGDPPVTELAAQLAEQLSHRRAHRRLIQRLVRAPVGLGVIGLKAVEELHGLRRPATEPHSGRLTAPHPPRP